MRKRKSSHPFCDEILREFPLVIDFHSVVKL